MSLYAQVPYRQFTRTNGGFPAITSTTKSVDTVIQEPPKSSFVIKSTTIIDSISAAYGMLANRDKSLNTTLLSERKSEIERDNQIILSHARSK
ncbi:hypothetical protein [Leptolinea tardivitalis]|uniref:hypothetical protein n=1 Tax=Leptolinea tardivitalis TaxID=229920 RepID=UPI001111C7B7|nr:hypothetical protein [Leptolinea tardivitalis]GAP20434.1 hypothetical protein LTAR_00623 [Leptolinea tardivitalis]